MSIITPILNPFANGRTIGTLPNSLPNLTPGSPDTAANQQTGFPLLQAQPLGTTNAIPVKEEEMNGVLYFYTNLLYQQGLGYQYTFDANLSTAVGGYSQGAVLFCASNNTYQISLKNNNTANFVTTPSYINDNTNWQQISYIGVNNFPDIIDNLSNGSLVLGNRINGSSIVLRTNDPMGANYAQIAVTNDGISPYMNHDLYNSDGSINTGIEYKFNSLPQLTGQSFTGIAGITINPASLYTFGNISYDFVFNTGVSSYTIVTLLNQDHKRIISVSGYVSTTITNPSILGVTVLSLPGIVSIYDAYGPASVRYSPSTNLQSDCYISSGQNNLYVNTLSSTVATFLVTFSIIFISS